MRRVTGPCAANRRRTVIFFAISRAGGGARVQKIRKTRTWAFSQGLHELDDKYLVISLNFEK